MPRQGKYPDEVREPTTGVGLDTQQAVRRAEQRDLRGDVVAVLTGNRVIAADGAHPLQSQPALDQDPRLGRHRGRR